MRATTAAEPSLQGEAPAPTKLCSWEGSPGDACLMPWNHITFAYAGRAGQACRAGVPWQTPCSWLPMGPWKSWVTSAAWNRDRPHSQNRAVVWGSRQMFPFSLNACLPIPCMLCEAQRGSKCLIHDSPCFQELIPKEGETRFL